MPKGSDPAGMCRVPGGTFINDSLNRYVEAVMLRRLTLGDFWIGELPVTAQQFTSSVAAAGHVTTAEITSGPVNYRGMLPWMNQVRSLVFYKTVDRCR